jgi:hypothetical protein
VQASATPTEKPVATPDMSKNNLSAAEQQEAAKFALMTPKEKQKYIQLKKATDLFGVTPHGASDRGFGMEPHPILGGMRMHTGQDFKYALGTPLRAPADGVVTKVKNSGGYGLQVEIKHNNGLTSSYSHLSAANVIVGSKVKQGDFVANVGSTGRSTGPHLHYETRINGKPVDPLGEGYKAIIAARGGQQTTPLVTTLEVRPNKIAGNIASGNNKLNIVYTRNGGIQVGSSGDFAAPLQNMLQATSQNNSLNSNQSGGLMDIFSGLFGGGGQGTAGQDAGQGNFQNASNTGSASNSLPVLYLTAEQYAAVLQTGQLPDDLTTAQNNALPTDCTNQTTGIAADPLLRPECRTPEVDMGSGDTV